MKKNNDNKPSKRSVYIREEDVVERWSMTKGWTWDECGRRKKKKRRKESNRKVFFSPCNDLQAMPYLCRFWRDDLNHKPHIPKTYKERRRREPATHDSWLINRFSQFHCYALLKSSQPSSTFQWNCLSFVIVCRYNRQHSTPVGQGIIWRLSPWTTENNWPITIIPSPNIYKFSEHLLLLAFMFNYFKVIVKFYFDIIRKIIVCVCMYVYVIDWERTYAQT